MKFVSLIGDLSRIHIYENHQDAVKEQLNRDPNAFELPILVFSQNFYKQLEVLKKEQLTKRNLDLFIESLEPEDFILQNYKSFGTIKAEMVAPKNNKDELVDNNNS